MVPGLCVFPEPGCLTLTGFRLQQLPRNGDFWAPFQFNLLLNADRDENPELARALISFPANPLSPNAYRLPFVDPLSEPVRELHVWRDRQLAGRYGADALYYDISVNDVLMILRHKGHGHPVGGGGWVVDAYTSLLAQSKEAASQAAGGRYVPQGAELISELMIPYLDFYQARAEASPLSVFEADYFRNWIKRGRVEKIPLFADVYHEYGPLRLDGWGKLSREVGDLFFWVASRVVLWRGLFELNYEFSPLEVIDERLDLPRQHYYAFEPREFAIDPARVAFVRELARARTDFAREFPVYGTMRRPLSFAAPHLELDYFSYNAPRHLAHYGERGSLPVPAVVHGAWEPP